MAPWRCSDDYCHGEGSSTADEAKMQCLKSNGRQERKCPLDVLDEQPTQFLENNAVFNAWKILP